MAAILLMATQAFAQITGKFGNYYDQRELLFEAMPTSENDIIFLGNSITDGGEWFELFQNANCKNRGISGDITLGVLNRLETITKGKPAMVFLMIGTNDMNHGYSNDTISLNVRQIVQRIKQESPRTKIIVQSILPTNDCYGLFTGHTKRYSDVAVINGMLKTMADEEDVEYLDLYSRFANNEGKMNPLYSNDGLHLNANGYLLWKDIVEEMIEELPEKTYISIDIDALDPKLCPNTGTPVPGGMEYEELMYLLNKIRESGKEIIGFDLCEVSPGDNDWDGNVGARVLFHLCGVASAE